MSSGAFRDDLYYRISEITIAIPPVREREGGRILLAQYLLNKFAQQQGRSIKGFTDDAHDAIETYEWPGNVREMENKIKARRHHGGGQARDGGRPGAECRPRARRRLNLRVVRNHAETHAIRQALVRSGGNISRAAELLGITRPTLYDLMAKYEINATESKPSILPRDDPLARGRRLRLQEQSRGRWLSSLAVAGIENTCVYSEFWHE